MRYTLDTEFDERAGDGVAQIQLISVAVIAQDGRELYMENAGYDWDQDGIDPWLIANVRPHMRGGEYALTAEQMRERATAFFAGDNQIEMWAYYADYDWVALCSIFGRMVDIKTFCPGMPKLCLDLKQAVLDAGIPKSDLPEQDGDEHDALADCRWNWQLLRLLDDRARAAGAARAHAPSPAVEETAA